MKQNPLLDAALDECRKAGVPYWHEATAKGHIKLCIASSPRIVIIGCKGNGRIDVHAIHNVRADVRRAIKLI